MNDKCFQYIMNLYFIFYHGFMIYIILIFSYLIFSFKFFKKIMTSAYLSKHFNFISVYDGIFSNFNYYKCLCNNAPKHFKMMHKAFQNTHSNANILFNKIIMT